MKETHFRYMLPSCLVVFIIIVIINTINYCDAYERPDDSVSGYTKGDDVQSSGVKEIPHTNISFDSNPMGAWISIDGKNKKLMTPQLLQIEKKSDNTIEVMYNHTSLGEEANKTFNDLDSLNTINYDFFSKEWNPNNQF